MPSVVELSPRGSKKGLNKNSKAFLFPLILFPNIFLSLISKKELEKSAMKSPFANLIL